MNTESEVYEELRAHLDRLPVGFPSTQTGIEIRILKHLFTPEEARMATQLSMLPEPLHRIYKRVRKSGILMEEVEQLLDRMAYKGIALLKNKGGKKYYSNAMLAVGMYEHQVDRLTKDFAEDMLQYLDEAFAAELYRTKIPQLRPVPIEKSIPQEYGVSTYDSIREIVADIDGQIVVANCVCRQAKDTVGESCCQTDLRETCLIFRDSAQRYLDMGLARPISREEAFGILAKAEEAGLVLQPVNSQRPQAVCCCCGDCCGLLMAVKKFPRPAELCATSYYAEVDEELCTGCEACAGRCQLQAVALLDDVSRVDHERCIGCGVCVSTCTSNAIQLHKKPSQSIPPKTTGILYKSILSKKTGKWAMLGLAMRRLVGLQV
jgi:electron transport complex protein RnfB